MQDLLFENEIYWIGTCKGEHLNLRRLDMPAYLYVDDSNRVTWSMRFYPSRCDIINSAVILRKRKLDKIFTKNL
jgi:hypothetical protein